MSATDAVARMLTLVPWLLERPGASLTETAEAFGVSEAVIRGDLDHLDFCGLPGLGGGDLFDVTLVEDRIVVTMADELRRPMRPTPGEALRLVLTASTAAAVMGDEVPALRSAVAKVRDALGVPEGAAEVVGPTVPSGAAALVRQAVESRRRVRLTYQGRADAEPRDREVDPWAVHLVDGSWYLQGHDHGVADVRSFRLDRIADVAILDEDVAQSPPADLPPPRYVPGPDDVEVILETDRSARWLSDAVEPDEVSDLPHGGVRIVFRTDALPWVTRLLLMAGGGARAMAPADLDRTAADVARAALGRYPTPPD